MKTIRPRIFSPLLRASYRSPRARSKLIDMFLRLSSNDEVTPSVYGPLLQTRRHDLTFRFCVSGAYGRYLSTFLSKYSEPFSFIDIGANVGLYSLIAAKNSKCISCYAFEPNPDVFQSLQRNIELNRQPKIRPFNAAVSETEGQLRFSFDHEHSGAGSLDANGTMVVNSLNRRVFDEIAKTDSSRKVVKIDVEGHEPTVIAELLKSEIRRQLQNVFFEVHESRYDVSAVVATLYVPWFCSDIQER